MSDIPKLPDRVSPDGREIWDWAAKVSAHIHKTARVRELLADIAKVQRECGSCNKWMMKSSCPREAHHKVSAGETICKQFAMDSRRAAIITKWQQELIRLNDGQMEGQ